jgi:dTDP-4-dehydrorhamnose reductase
MSPRGDRPEVWAGVEGTVNRVGDRWFDQCARSGHSRRDDDLERFAALGIAALRYPVLWEVIAPDGLREADWSFPDERLPRLRALGVRPIIGLLHHGSGPASTSLVDPAFPGKLAAYARAVAERYPWVEEWTPVNEPLTTARFSGLYGHWYPHGRDDRTFVRALVGQVRATALAMREIRAVVPGARLVQTEDMGRTASTPRLRYEAEFQNERRWLSYDLLLGRVGRDHRFRRYLEDCGATPEELGWLEENPTPPDVVGLNCYVTSDRWVDERADRYPEWSRGGRLERFADVHAAIGDPAGIAGHRFSLERAWERYRLPVALTEVHLGGPREEQLRWLAEAWDAVTSLRAGGADVRALTVWSLLGAFDWNTLVTAEHGFYEPGPFDVRSPAPRPTALARMTRALATEGRHDHPVLAGAGWWRRPGRLVPGSPAAEAVPGKAAPPVPGRPILILGGTGTLGRAFARICHHRGLAHRLLRRAQLDITSPADVHAILRSLRPWAVVNAAGYVRVDDAEHDVERCLRENADGPAVLAAACAARGVSFATFSSDLVFDGASARPYVESDPVAPLNVYGRSKAEAERRVLAAHAKALVVRTSAFFGPWDAYNFVTICLAALRRGDRFTAAEDQVVSPTYVPDLAHAVLDLLVDGERGVWHLANAGATTWADLARAAARLARLDPGLVVGVPAAALALPAPRPHMTALGTERGALLPTLTSALERYVADRAAEDAVPAGGGRAAGCPVCGSEGHQAEGAVAPCLDLDRQPEGWDEHRARERELERTT